LLLDDKGKPKPYVVRIAAGAGSVTWVAQDLSDRQVMGERDATSGWVNVWDAIMDWRNEPVRIGNRDPMKDPELMAVGNGATWELGRSFHKYMDLPSKSAALIGIAEKGALTLELTATATPGHSSMPPVAAGASAIGMLSEALARLEARQMPFALAGVGRETFDTVAPEMAGVTRVLLSNLWLFGPLVAAEVKKSPSANASFRTTTALTVVNAGQAENVLPGRATALVNFRLLPGDSSDAVVDHVVRTIANSQIKVDRVPPFSEASRVASIDGAGYRTIARTIAELHPDIVVAPGLMIGGTDSRHFDGIAENVYKFSPMRARPEDLKRFHGTNERISTANYVELIQFYHQLIGNAQPDA